MNHAHHLTIIFYQIPNYLIFLIFLEGITFNEILKFNESLKAVPVC